MILGLFWDGGKQNGNYYNDIVYWGCSNVKSRLSTGARENKGHSLEEGGLRLRFRLPLS